MYSVLRNRVFINISYGCCSPTPTEKYDSKKNLIPCLACTIHAIATCTYFCNCFRNFNIKSQKQIRGYIKKVVMTFEGFQDQNCELKPDFSKFVIDCQGFPVFSCRKFLILFGFVNQ